MEIVSKIYSISVLLYIIALAICKFQKNDWEVDIWDDVPLAVGMMFIPIVNLFLALEFVVEIKKKYTPEEEH